MADAIRIAITPAALIVGALLGTWRMQLHPRTDLGLRLPASRHVLIFSGVFLVLMLIHEGFYWLFSDAQPADWRKYEPGALALRVVFAGVIYPVAEELFFRGFLLGAISRKAGAVAGIVATAVLFTALHNLQGPWVGALQVFGDGLYFAFVRWRSGSLLLPISFHVVGNSVAIMQRIF